MKDLTPENMRCSFGACSAVYELEDGRLLIVGKKPEHILRFRSDWHVGPGETAIIIDRKLLANVPRDEA